MPSQQPNNSPATPLILDDSAHAPAPLTSVDGATGGAAGAGTSTMLGGALKDAKSPKHPKQTRYWMRLVPAMFILAWGGNHFTPLLHLYEDLGNYEVWQANFLLGTYVAGLIPGLLVASALSDKYGRKPVMFAGMFLAMAGSLLLALGFQVFWELCVGRMLAGIGVGIAMSVGTSWMKELSGAPYDVHAGASAGARRPSLTLTLGFGIGAVATGVLAQWAPMPSLLPYVLHGTLSVVALFWLAVTPESLPPENRTTSSWWQDLRVPSAGHRTFTRLIMPAAPWVFGAAAVAYAIMPSSVAAQMGDYTTIYAAGLTILTLGVGAAVQPFYPRINQATGGRAIAVGMFVLVTGLVLAVVAVILASPVFVILVDAVLGAGYGITLVSGLAQVQRIATPSDLAGLTGIYYSLTYVGFLLPTILAMLLPVMSYAVSLSLVTALCTVCLVAVLAEYRRMRRAA